MPLVSFSCNHLPHPPVIERVDHAFRGVVVEPGESHVRFRYDPNSTRLGLLLGFFGVLTLLYLAFGRRSTSAAYAGKRVRWTNPCMAGTTSRCGCVLSPPPIRER